MLLPQPQALLGTARLQLLALPEPPCGAPFRHLATLLPRAPLRSPRACMHPEGSRMPTAALHLAPGKPVGATRCPGTTTPLACFPSSLRHRDPCPLTPGSTSSLGAVPFCPPGTLLILCPLRSPTRAVARPLPLLLAFLRTSGGGQGKVSGQETGRGPHLQAVRGPWLWARGPGGTLLEERTAWGKRKLRWPEAEPALLSFLLFPPGDSSSRQRSQA